MANEFQPQLPQAQVAKSPSGSFSPTNTGAIGTVFNTISNNSARARKAAAQAKQEGDFSELLGGTLELDKKFNDTQFELQNTLRQIDTLQEGGISEDERPESQALTRKFENLKQAIQLGVGNEFYYRSQVNILAQKANDSSPALAGEIVKFINGPLGSIPEASTAQGRAQVELQTLAEDRFGPNYGAKDVTKMVSEARQLKQYNEDIEFGTIATDQLKVTTTRMHTLSSQAYVQKWQRRLDQKGVLLPADERERQTDLMELKARGDMFADKMIAEERSKRNLSFEQEKEIRDALTDSQTFISTMFEGNDAATKSKELLESASIHFSMNIPLMLDKALTMNELAGVPGMSALNIIMQPDSPFRSALEASSLPQLSGLKGEELNNKMALILEQLFSDYEFVDPIDKKIANTLSTGLLQRIPSEPAAKQVIKSLSDVTKDEDDRLQQGNVQSAIKFLMTDKTRKRNFKASLTPEIEEETRILTTDWLDKTIGALQETIESTDGRVDVAYDRSTQRFVTNTKPALTSNPRGRPASDASARVFSETLNSLIALSKDDVFGRLSPTTKEVVSITNSRLSESRLEVSKQRLVDEANDSDEGLPGKRSNPRHGR